MKKDYYTAGIDIGSISTKAALMNKGELVGTRIIHTGYSAGAAGDRVFEKLLSSCVVNRRKVKTIVATGYGRNAVGFAHKTVTEITCHARGALYQDASIRSIVDIGGQDSKVIQLTPQGKVLEFVMNDKCAAGTGRFLEVMARALEVDLNDFGTLASEASQFVSISSLCTVFAESEVISLIAGGESRENIINGIHHSIAARVAGMAKRIDITGPVMMTGGVSLNAGVAKALETRLAMPVIVPPMAQANGAIGAALMAWENS